MKEQIIQIPDTLEIKEIKDGKIILVEKEKKLTYNDIVRKLFPDTEIHYYTDSSEYISRIKNNDINNTCVNNAKSERQLEKLFAINMLMNVAKYLNGDWQPDWSNNKYDKYYICCGDRLFISNSSSVNAEFVYFKSEELAKQAVKILGEETIRLAFCTDY